MGVIGFKPIKIFWSIVTWKKKNEKLKTKLKERLVELTEKYLKIEENVNIYDCWTNWKIYKNREIYKRSTLF